MTAKMAILPRWFLFPPPATALLALAAVGLAYATAPPQGDALTAESYGRQRTSQLPDEAPPSLDELLGLEREEQDHSAAEAARRDAEQELQRALAEARITDAFALALEKMTISADLLELQLDPGLGTQRLQEEILSKLDEMIDQARDLKSMGGKPLSDGGRSQSATAPRRQPGHDASCDCDRCASSPQDPQQGGLPPRRDEEINRVLEETATEWGHLPGRIRDMLLQGRNERFSSLYEQLTREYYERLAEEGSL